MWKKTALQVGLFAVEQGLKNYKGKKKPKGKSKPRKRKTTKKKG